MVTLTQMREGLAANLRVIGGVQVSPYILALPTPPAIHVFPAEIEYDVASVRGADLWRFTVQAFVGVISDIGAQKRLDEFLAPAGSGSVKEAVEADTSLGGIVDDLRVTGARGNLQLVVEGRGPVLAAEWTVEIYADGA